MSRNRLVGRISHLYAGELPSPRHRFDGSGGYEHFAETLAAYHYELTGTP
ncbi:hypothetical protein ABZ371_02940 [Streptomyces sp. NPDC005899]